MSFPLVRKELRDQLPFLVLVLSLWALNLVHGLVTGEFGAMPIAREFSESYSQKFGAVALLLLAFALGSGLLAREREEGTLEFLDALPISRTRLFLTKIAVGWSVLMVGGVIEWLQLLTQHALTRSSLDPSWHLGLLTTGFLMEGAVVYVGLALGIVLSFFGRLNWLLLGLAVLGVIVLGELLPSLAILDPSELTLVKYEGTGWRLPSAGLALHLPLATALLAVSGALFSGALDRPLRTLTAFLSGPAAMAVTAATIVVGIAAVGVAAYVDSKDDAPSQGPRNLVFETPGKGSFQSQHYAFSYPATLQQRAGPVMDAADPVFEKVRARLRAPEGEIIPVDLGESAQHTSGVAFWNKIRVDLTREEPLEETLATLAHETVHVLASRTVGAHRNARLGAMRAFAEGLATYVEHQLYPKSAAAEEGRFIAAVVHQRRQVRLMELLDSSKLAATQDADLVYPLGEILVEAMVELYGDDAPVRLLEAIGREDAPEALSPSEIWQDAFLAARMDLGRVLGATEKRLEREVRDRRALIETLPRPGVSVSDDEEGDYAVTPTGATPLPDGWSVVLRFRADAATSFLKYEGPYWIDPDAGGSWFLPYDEVKDRVIHVQVGLKSATGPILYEPWTQIPVD